jgi:hypothetical protein
MYTARSIWIAETLVSFVLVVLIGSQLSGEEVGSFIVAEFGVFMVSFVLALFFRPVKVLALGVGIAITFATLLSLGGSASCSEGGIICFSAGDLFALGLIVAGALYPGWAFGTGVGTLTRLQLGAERDPIAGRSSR